MADRTPVRISASPGKPQRTRLQAWLARRKRDERGATLIEAAFVTPVFVLLIFGIIEFSGYVAARTAANSALKAGMRMATISGNDPLADRNILKEMAQATSGFTSAEDEIKEIRIWKDETKLNDPRIDPKSLNCFDITQGGPGGSASDSCNIYRSPNWGDSSGTSVFKRAQLPRFDPEEDIGSVDESYADFWFGCDPSGSTSEKYDCGWPPSSRQVEIGRGDGGPVTDKIGIYIEVTHHSRTGLFGREFSFSMEATSVIEPQGYCEPGASC